MFNAKRSLTITISDVRGSKSYNISQALKKAFRYFIIFIILTIGTSFFLIKYLYIHIDEINAKKADIVYKLESLQTINNDLHKDIKTRKEELVSLNDKIEDVEKIIGLRTTNDNELYSKRVNLALITVIEKKYMLFMIPNGWPLVNKGITSRYGWRDHVILKKKDFHTGIDLRAKMRTKIKSPADGVVRYAGYNTKGYGYMMIVSHAFGFETLYAHLDKLKAKVGDVVLKGDVLALSGNSGLSSGPHLHYEIRYAQKTLNPIRFLRWGMKNYNSIFEKEKKVKWHSLINLIKKEMKIFKQVSSQKKQLSKGI
jgi:murein DD-endopeptidase MepM/ murein hydrolase activator NlpD